MPLNTQPLLVGNLCYGNNTIDDSSFWKDKLLNGISPKDLISYHPENLEVVGESQILILKKFWDFLEGYIEIIASVPLAELKDLFEYGELSENAVSSLEIKLSKEINSINFITELPFKCNLYQNKIYPEKRIKITENIAKILNKVIFPHVYKKFVFNSFQTAMTSQIEKHFEIKFAQT